MRPQTIRNLNAAVPRTIQAGCFTVAHGISDRERHLPRLLGNDDDCGLIIQASSFDGDPETVSVLLERFFRVHLPEVTRFHVIAWRDAPLVSPCAPALAAIAGLDLDVR